MDIHFRLAHHARRNVRVVEVWDGSPPLFGPSKTSRLVGVIYPNALGVDVISKFIKAPPLVDSGIVTAIAIRLDGDE